MSTVSATQGETSLRFSILKRFAGFELDVEGEVPAGITMLFGASGSGKSTLLKCIAGLTEPERGRIELSGLGSRTVLFDRGTSLNLSSAKRGIGFVFQDLALFPHMCAEENIAYGLNRLADGERRARVGRALEAFGIAHLRRKRPGELSGGEKQRVALARALVTEPRALMLDEPLSALDPATKTRIMDDLRSWIADRQIPVLYVTHNREEVFALGHRVIALENGRVIGQGSPREVMRSAQHESIAEWSGIENIFEGSITALHDAQGTMTFRTGDLELEVPLGRAKSGDAQLVGISANDILLAVEPPRGLSARNVLEGQVVRITQRDVVVTVVVECNGVKFEAHVTPAAIHQLALTESKPVWLVIKTHSIVLIHRDS